MTVKQMGKEKFVIIVASDDLKIYYICVHERTLENLHNINVFHDY